MIAAAALAIGAALQPQLANAPAAAVAGVSAAIAACDAWLTKPDTWADNIESFPTKAGLAQQIVGRPAIPDAAMPPAEWRVSPHYWYANLPLGGIFITTSDRLPVCNAIGGSGEDIQPSVETALADPLFASRWRVAEERNDHGLRSTRYISKADPKLAMTVTRADKPSGRLDRAQVAITASYSTGK